MEQSFSKLKSKGNEKYKAKEYENAIKCYTEAIKLKRDEPSVYTNRALCYIYLQRYFEAKNDCDIAIRLNPDLSKAYYRRGTALKGLMRYKSALEDFNMVVDLEPGFDFAEKEVNAMEKILSQDKRIDFRSVNKPQALLSKLPMKTFNLNNHNSGVQNYNE